MTSPRAYTEALELSLARVIADSRRELEVYRAKTEALLADARAQLVEVKAANAALVAELRQAVAERLATVKDGDPGRDGIDGKDGVDGKDGLPGADGKDGAPGADGRDGTNGLDGIDGKDGLAGAEGAAGAPGVDGRDGVDGINGVDGRDGAPGERGIDGANGRDGIDGKDGIPGERGERGLDGAPGKLPVVRAWADAVHYEGACVTLHGALWQAQKDTGNSPPHEDWTCLAAAGEHGRSIVVRGTYDAEAEYRSLDVVALNGGSFVALRDAPGECPGEGWQLITSPGKRGQKGEDGGRGLPGDPGRKGDPGPALIAAVVDGEGMLTLTREDGVEITADFYPVLRK
jgi:hypothetical protein